MNELNPLYSSIQPIGPIKDVSSSKSVQPAQKPGAASFDDLLQQTVRDSQPIKFSAHAQNRLQHRQIALSDPQVARLEKGITDAAGKGAESSLVLLDNLAFIVSVRNRTVVTALDSAQTNSHVFTQIDSAVIA